MKGIAHRNSVERAGEKEGGAKDRGGGNKGTQGRDQKGMKDNADNIASRIERASVAAWGDRMKVNIQGDEGNMVCSGC